MYLLGVLVSIGTRKAKIEEVSLSQFYVVSKEESG